MTLPKQKFREVVFLLLYSYDFTADFEESIPLVMEELRVSKKAVLEAVERAKKILEKMPDIDEKIAEFSTSYEFQRIPRAEKNILRLAIFELLFEGKDGESLPEKVVISEGIRLARKFASFEAASFVNAVLDAIKVSKKADADEPPSSIQTE
jgi:transcription antitermination protein NusB